MKIVVGIRIDVNQWSNLDQDLDSTTTILLGTSNGISLPFKEWNNLSTTQHWDFNLRICKKYCPFLFHLYSKQNSRLLSVVVPCCLVFWLPRNTTAKTWQTHCWALSWTTSIEDYKTFVCRFPERPNFFRPFLLLAPQQGGFHIPIYALCQAFTNPSKA